jgi:uncharacterized protein YbjT (DUF2867 family)
MKTTNLNAVLIGATGLVGSEILRFLLADERFSKVTVLGRRSTGIQNSKLEEHLVDFRNVAQWKNLVHGDLAFSALGTTRKQAGSIEAQYEVDYTYQAEFARVCAQCGVERFILISAMGANSHSRIPYSRMKGQLEDFVESLGFQHIHILRPGPLEGHRAKKRLGEEISIPITKILSKLPGLADLRPVSGKQVALQAVQTAFRTDALQVLGPQAVRGF